MASDRQEQAVNFGNLGAALVSTADLARRAKARNMTVIDADETMTLAEAVASYTASPPSPLLVECVRIARGGVLEEYRVPDPAFPSIPIIRHRPAALPSTAPRCLDEARRRIRALKVILAPCQDENRIRQWCTTLAAAMDSMDDPIERASQASLMARRLQYPTMCFTREAQEEVFRQQRRDGRSWFPSYVRLCEIFNGMIRPYADEVRDLEGLLRRVDLERASALPPPDRKLPRSAR